MSARPQPPALLVEQLALGELPESRAAALCHELGGADQALDQIEGSNREILAEHPPERVAAEVLRRRAAESSQASRGWFARSWVLVPVAVAAAVLVWFVIREPRRELEPKVALGPTLEAVEREPTRIKGGAEPHVVVDRKTAAGHERLSAGASVRAGELVQVSVVAAGRREGVVVSIDGAGAVTLHHPSDAGAEPTLLDGHELPLPHAYELDDAPDFERFVFVTRDGEPVLVAEVLAAAERLAATPSQAASAPLDLAGEGWAQYSVLLRKAVAAAEEGTP